MHGLGFMLQWITVMNGLWPMFQDNSNAWAWFHAPVDNGNEWAKVHCSG